MSTVPPIPMFAPDGTLKQVPNHLVDQAAKAGGQAAVKIVTPDGDQKYAPQSQVRQLLQMGAKLAPVDQGPTAPTGSALSRFGSAAIEPIVGTAKGLFQTFTTPAQGATEKVLSAIPGALPVKRMIVSPALQQGQQAIDAARQGRYSEAAGHGLAAALPVVGPWAAQVGETGGKQLGSGDIAGVAGTLVGNAALAAAPEIGKRVIPPALRKGGEILGGTKNATKALVEKTEEGNAAETAKAAEKQVAQDAKRAQELQKFHEKVRTEPETSLESGRPRTKEELQSHKEALNRGLEKLDTDFQSDLKETQERVRKESGAKYDAVRSKVGDAALPEGTLSESVKQAQSHIKGSTENLKIFQDILRKHPEDSPDTIPYQGASIPKGHPLYDVLREQGHVQGAPPATFSDLQGYYSELGSQLSKGNLPGDVYLAVRDLHSDIGNMMQTMADDAGAGPDFSDARRSYRQYMQTFRDSKSPIYKAINATERGKSIGALAGKDQTGIEALAKYDPSLARRANTLRDYQAEAKAISSPKAEPYKAPAKLSSKLEPVKANTKTIGQSEVQASKAKALQDRIKTVQHRGEWIVSGAAGYGILESAMHGNLGHIPRLAAEGILAVGSVSGISKLLENPSFRDFVTKATPADVAKIPPALRGSFDPVLFAAKQEGLPISKALIPLIGGAANQPKHPTLSDASPVQ